MNGRYASRAWSDDSGIAVELSYFGLLGSYLRALTCLREALRDPLGSGYAPRVTTGVVG